MRNGLVLVCCACLAGCGALRDGDLAAAELSLVTTPLRDLAGPNVAVVGAAVSAGPLRTEPAYAATLATNYNQVTPVVALKWEVLRPSAAVFHFTDADAIVAAAEVAGQSVRGHTLVWEVNLPSWFTALTGNAVRTAMLTHISTVVSRYRGRIAHWDVVNEPLTAGGTYRNNIFLQAMGSGYIAEAFRAANLADPSARLAYNDFGIEVAGAKQNAAYTMVRDLRTAGVPIHEVGIQLHTRPAAWVAGTMTAAQLRSAMGAALS
jgi:endo-1,4-beta-xylanase